ncbi:YceI family protein [Danxiaibacter flavus]|uniref:YceI family protein n=1 Tax=Danxiaibacter flavus TaxID=3049108 RepID=A0ABV3Z8C5_9BACT|nr:YceI family protein [Chitinophagaceae bacterium DXS]
MKNIFCLVALFIGLTAFVDLKPVDAEKSVTFSINNFGLATRGEFKGLKGAIKWVPENPATSYFNVTIDANSINTDNDMRDSHLRKEEYFDVGKYPNITFTSSGITGSNGQYSATGNLTIKNKTKNITIPFTVDQTSNGYQFNATFSINRRDYGVGGGSMVMSDIVKVTLKVNALP